MRTIARGIGMAIAGTAVAAVALADRAPCCRDLSSQQSASNGSPPAPTSSGKGLLAVGDKLPTSSGKGLLAVGDKLPTSSGKVLLAMADKLPTSSGKVLLGIGDKPQTSSGKALLGIGDKLKISFFETIDVASAKPGDRSSAEPPGTLRTFYQRMDLSGEYAIEEDGVISIPLLGRLQVAGRTLNDVRADLAASFADVMRRRADVNVTIIEQPPIYVVGSVK